jgi:hypothetical protein
MMKARFKPNAIAAAAAALTLAILAGCGGGSSPSATTGTSTSPGSSPTQAAATTLTGTVAVGNAVSGAIVTVTDVNGNTSTASQPTGINGSYSVSISGLKPPFAVVAVDPTGVNPTMVSVLAQLPSNGTVPTANVTTLTTAVSALLTTSGNPLDVTNPANLQSLVSPLSVSQAESTLDAAIAPILAANGLSTTTFDPIGAAFTPNQTFADAVIDSVQIVPSATGGLTLVTTGTAAGSSASAGIPLNQSTVTASTPPTPLNPPLNTPSSLASALSGVISGLGQCLSSGGSNCSVIDPNFRENGYAAGGNASLVYQEFTGAHPAVAASGVTLGTPKVLFTVSTQNGTNGTHVNPSAQQQLMIQVPYTTSAGTAGSFITEVQQTLTSAPQAGAWDIIGNWVPFNVTIGSFLSSKQFLDSADSQKNRWEAGIGITIPAPGVNGNPSNLASASVSGPGINGTAWLERRSATGNQNLGLTQTTPATAPPTTTAKNLNQGANTSLYRWSWLAQPNMTASNPATNDPGYYNSANLTSVANIPQYVQYTVTLYDSNGNYIDYCGDPATGTSCGSGGAIVSGTTSGSGTPGAFAVWNTAPVVLAAAGSTLSWQSLSSSTSSAFLSPTGSLATSAQTSVPVAWSNLVNGQNVAPLVTGIQIQAGPSSGTVDGWWEGTTGIQSSGQYSETVVAGMQQNGTLASCSTSPCQFPALASGNTNLVQLYWVDSNGISYYNTWQYNN